MRDALTHRAEVGEAVRARNGWTRPPRSGQEGCMRVVITGSNRGIGLEFVRQFLQRGEKVHALCRHSSSELDALARSSRDLQILNGVDVSSPDSGHRILDHLGTETIDVLVQNAGILEREPKLAPSPESIRDQLEVNAIGPILLTLALLPRLHEGSKVTFVTSRMGSIADNGSGGYYGYRMSKAALNAGAVSLARDLAPKGIPVGIVHPGYVQTGMTGGHGDIDAATAAKQIIERIDQLDMARSGKFFHANGAELPW
jgi:NAD(P)-dependent dehydrogenase (short-subunit alcohol dehydrogenase family)